jgi:hypothetical protein
VAGQVLRCVKQKCGEIDIDNLCTRCGGHEPRQAPDWWMWRNGQRSPWHCRRCGNCHQLSFAYPAHSEDAAPLFKAPMTCPTCGFDHWQPRPVKVWTRIVSGPAGLSTLPADAPETEEDEDCRDMDDPNDD